VGDPQIPHFANGDWGKLRTVSKSASPFRKGGLRKAKNGEQIGFPLSQRGIEGDLKGENSLQIKVNRAPEATSCWNFTGDWKTISPLINSTLSVSVIV